MTYRDELRRKGIHLASALIPLGYLFLGLSREQTLLILAPLVLLHVALDLVRQGHPRFRAAVERWFGPLFRADERMTFCGATYVMLAAFLTVLIFPKMIAVTVLLMLSISDSLASLIGARFGGRFRFLGKSLAGSGAFFVSALLIAYLCLDGSWGVVLAGALVATVVEALPLRLGVLRVDDNLVVPLAAATAIWMVQASTPALYLALRP